MSADITDTRQFDPKADVAADGHDHGSPGDARITVTLMQRMGAWCNMLGSHGHPHKDERGKTTSVMHHHHDLRCLIEAGANQVRPALAKAEQARDAYHGSNQHLWQRVRALIEEKADLRRTNDLLSAQVKDLAVEQEQMLLFMRSMPGTGPWATVHDSWLAWQDEQEEESP